jgi:energy-coupling factor transporter ATP-binding protein EcfA2
MVQNHVPPTQPSGRSLLIDWATTRDDWIRGIAASILETPKELSDGQVEAAYQHLLVEKELAPGTRPPPPALVDSGTVHTVENALAVLGIDSVQRVNTLAPNQSITFNPKMTVLFGRNGSGKTGYVRILKRLSSVRREERVLPDITSTIPITDPPEARIRYRLGDAEQDPYLWRGAAGVPPFTRCDVFDAQDARTYIDDELTYVYTPTDIALFHHVAEALDRVRQKLDAAKRDKVPGPNLFASHIPRDVPFYSMVDALGPTTDLSELRTLVAISPEEEASLQGLKETAEALGSQSLQAQLQAAQAELNLYTQAKGVAEPLLTFDVRTYNEAVRSLSHAEQRRAEATQVAFAGDAIPGFLTGEWRGFIEAGEQYLKSLGLTDYPSPAAACFYCRQPLTTAALGLLRKYRDFCNDAFERAVATAREQVEDFRRPILRTDLRVLQQFVTQHEAAVPSGNTPPPALRATRIVLNAAIATQQAMGQPPLLPDDIIPADLVTSANTIEESATQSSDRLGALKGKAEERNRLLREITTKKTLLEARLTLRGLLPAIEAYVERAKWVSRAETILSRLKVSMKALTDASKLASKRLMNQDFERHFRKECESLNAPTVSLDFHGEKSQAARRKLLRPEYKLSDTLSEGEQKVIALADFLAEARLRTINAPVIFDDPVTSLDYERLREVASRLAVLADQRQVIVFTHNIWFAVELLDRFRDRKIDCSYYDVRIVEGRRGVVSGGTHPRSDTLADLRKRINTAVTEAKKLAGETQDAVIFRGYSLLRSLCEVAVESELLRSVVRRYEPNVMLTKLPEIKPQALKEAGERIFPIYENACRYIDSHSQPLEHLNIVRTVDELEQDLHKVLDAIEAYQKAAA